MRPGSLGDGGSPAPDEDFATDPRLSWDRPPASPPPSGPAAARVQPARAPRWRYRVLLAGQRGDQAGLAVSVAVVAVHLLPR
jgi:hypothetical protein